MNYPRLKNGRFISADCPDCGYGTLQPEGRDWRCNGLADPEDERKELIECERSIIDGVLYPHYGITP
jgi:hypothetical protein